MTQPTEKERREALRNRTRDNVKTKDSGGAQSKRAMQFPSGTNFYKVKKGRNSIDILPFIIKTNHHPQKMKPGYEDYILDVFVHTKIGPGEDTVVCLKKTFGKPCPICEEQADLRQNKSIPDHQLKKQLNALKPTRRAVYNIIDLEEPEKGVQIWEVSHFLFEKELLEEAETAESEVVTFADLKDGRSINFRATEESIDTSTFFKYKSISFQKREPYAEDILNETYSLDSYLVIPSYEEVQKLFLGIFDEEEDDDEKKEEASPRESNIRRTAVQRTAKDTTDEDMEEETPKEKVSTKITSGKKRCQYGHTFGDDCDTMKECKDCEDWNDCADAAEEGYE